MVARAKPLQELPCEVAEHGIADQMAAIVCSTSFSGATKVSVRSRWVVCEGAGKALRSTLRLGVSGNSSTMTKCAGTMCSGSRVEAHSCSCSVDTPASARR